jgi:hypothetical protein
MYPSNTNIENTFSCPLKHSSWFCRIAGTNTVVNIAHLKRLQCTVYISTSLSGCICRICYTRLELKLGCWFESGSAMHSHYDCVDYDCQPLTVNITFHQQMFSYIRDTFHNDQASKYATAMEKKHLG